ncbi:formate--phosphoribosylaminoimidazolecarboxamide ligase family protein [Candidatus Nitrosocosmicus franklandus]|uniref:5-formaminoimidazole-4-carboxamide-1-(Beta)-D-ribofuranosyl 5'-monophosphate synthetase n=1 Tax=Candidatus Nitrosocosmicus franklandianus TaxID=1798806 RepID=A0A484I8G9_9ARCH|nr:formate--phosphoribosylaminoimidazolecarboxamide ligase family protein [Candidatus Nitrosocosmicus franklandus]VFJ12584.1 5-formaminoimidazole-4-carboxamide-1-(beta)-D-ribofuranosyl 5'-monophosphate synthetase [Candidatus Nitrosocosmicus franklandus]
MSIYNILDNYDFKNITIGVLGSHSALEILDGAKEEGFRTLCICQKGRELPYQKFKRLSDDILILDSFSDLLNNENQQKLRDQSTVIVPHRSFVVYLGIDNIENKLKVPVFGNRYILKAEDRQLPKNQYHLLRESNIALPRIYKSPSEIDGPSIVKIQEAKRNLERAFFIVTSYNDYKAKSQIRIKSGMINETDLKNSIIEQYLIGTYFNFNYFYSPLDNEVEFLGIERRLQSNIHDFTTSIPAKNQLEMEIELQNIEVGHTPASIRESLLEKVFEVGDKFAKTCLKEYPPGIIGPYSLQSVVTVDLDIIVYDVSLRVPGNPILATTSPYTRYKYGETFGVGRRIAIEIKKSLKQSNLAKLVT